MTIQRRSWILAGVLSTAALATALVSGQTPSRPAGSQTPAPTTVRQGTPTFRAGADIIPIDVYPRDSKGQFVPDLSKDDFQVFEDGVEQKLLNFTRANGGQFYNDLASTAPSRPSEGLILPKAAPPSDTASRIFIIFIDDLHFMPSQTPEVRRLLQTIRDTLVHDNDLVGFVSSGHSSIEMDPAYDFQHRRFNEVINRVMGSGPDIDDMIRMQAGMDGLSELNYNAGVAFMAAQNLLSQLEDVRGKVKAFIWVSNGYSLEPFKDSRLQQEFQRYAATGRCDELLRKQAEGQMTDSEIDRRDPCSFVKSDIAQIQNVRLTSNDYGFDLMGRPTLQWKTGDLMMQLGELIRSAHRANVRFFTFDPRGLIAGFNSAARSQSLSNQEETEFIQQTTGTLVALAKETGGVACVGTNDCRPVLQRVDNMTSDYYILGYRSSNPDPFHLARKIEIKIKRPGVELVSGRDYRDMYYLKRPPREKK